MQGVPGSGKTTWAREFCEKNDFMRISRDDIRRMIHGKKYVPELEPLVKRLRDAMLHKCLELNWDVLLDETCIKQSTLDEIERIAQDYWCGVQVQRMYTPLETCIERDSKRPDPVGAEIITRMWNDLHGT